MVFAFILSKEDNIIAFSLIWIVEIWHYQQSMMLPVGLDKYAYSRIKFAHHFGCLQLVAKLCFDLAISNIW